MKTAEERFWDKVAKIGDNECWGWTGSKIKKGYGNFWLNRRIVKVHRFSYELHKGKIPDGLVVCHTCDNPPCVNPKHLWVGTVKDNAQDMIIKKRGADKKGEKSGHAKLTWKKVEKIRKMYSTGKYFQWEIGKIFLVSGANISDIIRNKTWIKK